MTSNTTTPPAGCRIGDRSAGHRTPQTTYDNLGRTTQTIADYTNGTPTNGSNQTTEYTYDGDDHTLTVQGRLAGRRLPDDAIRLRRHHARGQHVNTNDILAAVKYPDPTTGTAEQQRSRKSTP